MKIDGQNIDAILIYRRKYNYDTVAKKLTELGYRVGDAVDGFDALVYDQQNEIWLGQNVDTDIKDVISWEIFCSYDNSDINSNNKTHAGDDTIFLIAKLIETNEFIAKAIDFFPDTAETENMLSHLGKQIYDLIKSVKK